MYLPARSKARFLYLNLLVLGQFILFMNTGEHTVGLILCMIELSVVVTFYVWLNNEYRRINE